MVDFESGRGFRLMGDYELGDIGHLANSIVNYYTSVDDIIIIAFK
jgi:hypothetical protein